jgi:hypothetical protein
MIEGCLFVVQETRGDREGGSRKEREKEKKGK